MESFFKEEMFRVIRHTALVILLLFSCVFFWQQGLAPYTEMVQSLLLILASVFAYSAFFLLSLRQDLFFWNKQERSLILSFLFTVFLLDMLAAFSYSQEGQVFFHMLCIFAGGVIAGCQPFAFREKKWTMALSWTLAAIAFVFSFLFLMKEMPLSFEVLRGLSVLSLLGYLLGILGAFKVWKKYEKVGSLLFGLFFSGLFLSSVCFLVFPWIPYVHLLGEILLIGSLFVLLYLIYKLYSFSFLLEGVGKLKGLYLTILVLSGFVALLSYLVLIGWYNNYTFLVTLHSSVSYFSFVTAWVLFMLSGSLYFLLLRLHKAAALLAGLSLFVALTSLLEEVFAVHLGGITTFHPQSTELLKSGQFVAIDVVTGVCLFLLALNTFLRKKIKVSLFLNVLVFTISGTALLGHLFDIEIVLGGVNFFKTAIHASFSLFLLSIGYFLYGLRCIPETEYSKLWNFSPWYALFVGGMITSIAAFSSYKEQMVMGYKEMGALLRELKVILSEEAGLYRLTFYTLRGLYHHQEEEVSLGHFLEHLDLERNVPSIKLLGLMREEKDGFSVMDTYSFGQKTIPKGYVFAKPNIVVDKESNLPTIIPFLYYNNTHWIWIIYPLEGDVLSFGFVDVNTAVNDLFGYVEEEIDFKILLENRVFYETKTFATNTSPIHTKLTIPLGNREWTVFVATKELFNERHLTQLPKVFLMTGGSTVLLIFVIFLLLSRRYRNLQNLADEQKLTIVSKDMILLKQQKKATETKERLLSGVSHRLVTPLNQILGSIEVMKALPLDEMQEKKVDHVEEASRNLLYLINNLLELTEVTSGEIPLIEEPVDVVELISRVMANLPKQHTSKPIESVRFFPERLSPLLLDRRIIERVFGILIMNAYRFTKEGKVLVSLEEQDDHLVFEVKDQGEGMDAKQLAMVQEGLATGELLPAGVGLTLVYHYLKRLGGEMSVTSVRKSGTTVTITLPKKMAPLS